MQLLDVPVIPCIVLFHNTRDNRLLVKVYKNCLLGLSRDIYELKIGTFKSAQMCKDYTDGAEFDIQILEKCTNYRILRMMYMNYYKPELDVPSDFTWYEVPPVLVKYSVKVNITRFSDSKAPRWVVELFTARKDTSIVVGVFDKKADCLSFVEEYYSTSKPIQLVYARNELTKSYTVRSADIRQHSS